MLINSLKVLKKMSNAKDQYLNDLISIIENSGAQHRDREEAANKFSRKLKDAPDELLKYLPLLRVTEFVYNSEDETEFSSTFIFSRCKEILNEEEKNELDYKEIEKVLNAISLLDKIVNQYKLASFQKVSMDKLFERYSEKHLDPVQEISETLKLKHIELEEKQALIEKEQKLFEKNQKLIETRQKNSQRDFVAVLGMFTTIIFAAFGGLQLLAEVFKGLNETPLDVALVHGSFVFISLVLVLALLFSGLSRMSSLPIRSCDCDKANKDCNCSFAKKHPTVFFSLLLVSTIVSFAIVDKYFVFREILDGAISSDKGVEWGKLSILIQIAMVCSVPALIIIGINYLHKFFKWLFYSKVTRRDDSLNDLTE